MAASDTRSLATAPTRRFVPWLIGAGILLWFEFGMARQPAVREAVLESSFTKLEQQVIAPASTPQVVVFGNSRMLYGVDERQLADLVGARRSGVLKLTMNGASISQYLQLYRRNYAQLSQSRRVIIGIDDWDLAYAYRLNPQDIYYDSLQERLTVPDPRHIPLALVTWGCNSTYMLRPVIHSYGRQARDAVRSHLGRPKPRPGLQPIDEAGLFGERDPRIERLWADGEWYQESLARRGRPQALRWSATETVDVHCGSLPAITNGGLSQLERLVDLCIGNGARVLIVRPPLSDEYLQVFAHRYPAYAASFARCVAEMEGWAARSRGKLDVQVYYGATPVGLPATAFYDYGHPSPLGRRFLTMRLAEWANLRNGGAER